MNVGFAALTTHKGSLEALEYLFENGPRASGNDDWTLDLLGRAADTSDDPATWPGARYFATARLIRAANSRGIDTEERHRKRQQACELAIGLSMGVEDQAFIAGAAGADGARTRMTMADAERELMHRLATSVGSRIPDTKGRHLGGRGQSVGLRRQGGARGLLGNQVRPVQDVSFPAMRDMVDEFPPERFTIMGGSVDEKLETVVDFQAEESLPWIQWHVGKHSQMERDWDVSVFPTYVLIDL